MSTAGPNSPGTLVDDSSTGTIVWSNPGNAAASDNSYATAAITDFATSHYLKATNFGFSLPSNATVLGITVEVEMKQQGVAQVSDNKVRIVKGGTIGATEKSRGSGVIWPINTDTNISFGGAADLWGETWAYSDINANTFGFAISAAGNSVGTTASIDHIRITVTYVQPIAGTLSQTLSAASLSAAGQVLVQGVLSKTLADIALVADGAAIGDIGSVFRRKRRRNRQ